MKKIHPDLADRLDVLKEEGVISGWQPPGGPNYGLSVADLPALVFAVDGEHATSFYNEQKLLDAVRLLETFGPMLLFAGRR